jgi:hypothetical protein
LYLRVKGNKKPFTILKSYSCNFQNIRNWLIVTEIEFNSRIRFSSVRVEREREGERGSRGQIEENVNNK